MSIIDEIKKVISVCIPNNFRSISDKITESSDLFNDLGFDSMAQIGLMIELEKRFDVTIDDEESAGLRTVGQIKNYIFALLEEKNGTRKRETL